MVKASAIVDSETLAVANEALQTARSVDRVTEAKFAASDTRFNEAAKSIQRQFDEMKASLQSLDQRMTSSLNVITIKLETLSSDFSSKWWSLATGLILTLLGVCSFLAVKALVFNNG